MTHTPAPLVNNASSASPNLEREKVIQVALVLLDESGFAGLTLRRLADKLQVKAAALYWHFENKQDLINQVADRIIQEEYQRRALPDQTDWKSMLSYVARCMRAALQRYRDGSVVVANADLSKGLGWQQRERLVGRLLDEGFPPELALTALFSISRFTLGYVFEEQADPRSDHAITTPSDQPAWLGYNPTVATALHRLYTKKLEQPDYLFEQGLEIILAGIEQQLIRSAS